MTDTEGGYLGPQNLVLRFRSRLADEPGVTSFMRCIVRALSMLALVATMVATGFATCAGLFVVMVLSTACDTCVEIV